MTKTKGFTLIELLVVIAIISILFTAVVITLNPAQLLKQSRDATRISDLATLKSALGLYLSDVRTNVFSGLVTGYCYAHASSGVTGSGCGGRNGSDTPATSTSRAVTGTGWIPVNFSAISSGSPISVEPVDPINNNTYFYTFAVNTSNLTYEVTGNMESTKYASDGTSDVESTDGGTLSAYYEVGTAFGL